MTLAERRVLNEFQTNQLPDLKKKIDAAAGFEVPIEVNWESLAVPGESHNYLANWPAVYFEPLIQALSAVGADKIGQDAIKEGLKSIVIQNTKSCYYGDRWASIVDGVLTLDHEPLTNAFQVDDRTKGLIQVLESGL
jgi:hypothetical protein